MSRRRWVIIGLLASALSGGALIINAAPASGKNIRHVSEILNVTEPYSVIAVVPDVPAFMAGLRDGNAMRGFFDSPLGLHFLRSAPLRGAAHLHRFISLAPKSWQWNLYTLVTDGPVFYRSAGKKFSLVISLNNKGKLITKLVDVPHAAKEGDWLVVASDKETLKEQIAYLQKPAQHDFSLDANLRDTSSLSIAVGSAGDATKKKSLLRALMAQILGNDSLAGCGFKLRPRGDTLALEGECSASTAADSSATDEKITLADFPGYMYFRKNGAKLAHVLALSGFSADSGYLIPHLLYSGPTSDQKSIEFLSQAFKTRAHKLEAGADGIQIRYPSPYAYAKKKFDLFAPHLIASPDRFYWQSYLREEKKTPVEVQLNAAYRLFVSVKLFPLLKNSEAALKQFDAIYSPGHFNEFKEALAQSTPSLKKASLKIFTQTAGKKIRIGGALNFAEG